MRCKVRCVRASNFLIAYFTPEMDFGWLRARKWRILMKSNHLNASAQFDYIGGMMWARQINTDHFHYSLCHIMANLFCHFCSNYWAMGNTRRNAHELQRNDSFGESRHFIKTVHVRWNSHPHNASGRHRSRLHRALINYANEKWMHCHCSMQHEYNMRLDGWCWWLF